MLCTAKRRRARWGVGVGGCGVLRGGTRARWPPCMRAHHVEYRVAAEAAGEHLVAPPLPVQGAGRVPGAAAWLRHQPIPQDGWPAYYRQTVQDEEAKAGKRTGSHASTLRAERPPPEEGLDGQAQRAQRRHRQHLPPHKVHRLGAILSAQADVCCQAAACSGREARQGRVAGPPARAGGAATRCPASWCGPAPPAAHLSAPARSSRAVHCEQQAARSTRHA